MYTFDQTLSMLKQCQIFLFSGGFLTFDRWMLFNGIISSPYPEEHFEFQESLPWLLGTIHKCSWVTILAHLGHIAPPISWTSPNT